MVVREERGPVWAAAGGEECRGHHLYESVTSKESAAIKEGRAA